MDYEEAFKRQVETMFETTLRDLEAGGQEPSPWQVECFIDALAAMALNSWSLAEDLLISARLENVPRKPRFDGVTLAGLKTVLAESKRRRRE